MYSVILLTAALLVTQNSPRVAMLELDGWRAINAGNFPAAVDAFREAIRLDPANARLRLGAGTAEYGQRHDPEAKELLEQALDLDPKLTRARAQLALVAKRQGDLTEAIRLYEIVVSEVPDDVAVSETLERWKRERELHDRMRVEVGDGFAGVRALLPPPERRGCILIDPPYEEREDFSRLQVAVKEALQRFENAVLVLWLPVKMRADFDAWLRNLRGATARPVLASLLWMHPTDSRAALNGSALVVVNPPYLVEEALREWLPELRAILGGAQSGCEVLSASEPQ